MRFIAKTAVLVVSVNIISEHAEKMPRLALEYLYGMFGTTLSHTAAIA